MDISEEEIIRRYGVRWNIEVYFKTCKQHLKLLKESNSPSFDAFTCHLAIVCVRYMILAVNQRAASDDRTLQTSKVAKKWNHRIYDYVLALTSFFYICGVVYFTALRGPRVGLTGVNCDLPLPFLKAIQTGDFGVVAYRSLLNILLFVLPDTFFEKVVATV